MNVELSLSQIPPGGWQYHQAQTSWSAPTPKNSTFGQTLDLIRTHRLANPAIVAKHNLCVDLDCIAKELIAFTRTRLNMPESTSQPGGVAAAAPKQSRCCGG